MAVLWLCVFCGCGRAITRVSIPIKVQSEINVSRYSSFAVLPFLDEQREDTAQKVSSEETEGEIASLVRRRLGRHKNLHVLGTQETIRMLTGESIDLDLLADMDRLFQLGQYFEVDAVVVGSYRFYTVSQPRRYYGERYSRQLQRYVTDYQDYLQKNYTLSLRVVIADVASEEIVWDEKYERVAYEAHTLGSFLVSQATPDDNTLRSLATQAITEFTRQIAPHYETEERFLVR
jgi:TolB-like protein